MKKRIGIRKAAITVILSCLFTAMQITGYQISMNYNTTVHQSGAFRSIGVLTNFQCAFLAVTEFVFWNILFYFLFESLERTPAHSPKRHGKNGWRFWIVSTVVLFLCWIPCFLAGYPGFYNYDAFSQVPQALYEEVGYSAHHPLLHTLIMGKIIAFGYRHGTDLNDGIALHSIIQMLFCAMSFSGILCYIRKNSGRTFFVITVLFYYAFLPLFPMFAMSTTKDTVFSILLQLAIICVFDSCKNLSAFFNSRWKVFGCILLFVLMCLFRKNGIYAVICTIPFILLIYKKYRKQLILLFGMILMLYTVSGQGLAWILQAEAGSAEEMLSVPMQQIARVYNDYGPEAFETHELEWIYAGISPENLSEYDPFLSDAIKNYFDYKVIQDHKADYMFLWVRKGVQYPKAYLKAFLENTYQMWYPGTSIYDKPGSENTFYFDMGMCAGGYRDSKLPALLGYYEKIATGFFYQKIPFLRLFFSIGAMFWVILVTLAFALYKKRYNLVSAMLLLFFYCFTVLLGPISLVRYYYVLFIGFPVSIHWLLSNTDTAPVPDRL